MKTIIELTPFEIHEFILHPIAGRNFNDFPLLLEHYCLKHSTFEEYINDKEFYPTVDNFKYSRRISHPRVNAEIWYDKIVIESYRASYSLSHNGNIEYDFKSESNSKYLNPNIIFNLNGDISIDGKFLSHSQTLKAVEELKKNNIRINLNPIELFEYCKEKMCSIVLKNCINNYVKNFYNGIITDEMDEWLKQNNISVDEK